MLHRIVLMTFLGLFSIQFAYAAGEDISRPSIKDTKPIITLGDMMDIASQRLEILDEAGEKQLKNNSKAYKDYFEVLDQLYSWLIQENNKAQSVMRTKTYNTVNIRKKHESDIAWGVYRSFELQSDNLITMFKLKNVKLPKLDVGNEDKKSSKSLLDQILDFLISL